MAMPLIGNCRTPFTGIILALMATVVCSLGAVAVAEDDATADTPPINMTIKDASVAEVMDLCLSCKGCISDCPTHVDMASYKSEFLHHHYKRRLRPRSHYSLGWLPVLLRSKPRPSASAR